VLGGKLGHLLGALVVRKAPVYSVAGRPLLPA